MLFLKTWAWDACGTTRNVKFLNFNSAYCCTVMVSCIKKDTLSKQSLYTDQFTGQVNVLNVHQILFLYRTSPLSLLSAYLALWICYRMHKVPVLSRQIFLSLAFSFLLFFFLFSFQFTFLFKGYGSSVHNKMHMWEVHNKMHMWERLTM